MSIASPCSFLKVSNGLAGQGLSVSIISIYKMANSSLSSPPSYVEEPHAKESPPPYSAPLGDDHSQAREDGSQDHAVDMQAAEPKEPKRKLRFGFLSGTFVATALTVVVTAAAALLG